MSEHMTRAMAARDVINAARRRLIDAEEEPRASRDRIDSLRDSYKSVLIENWVRIEPGLEELPELAAEIERLKESEARAWRERNIAYAKVKGWEATVFVEDLPLRPVKIDEWGPGEGETVAVPDITPRKLTDLLDELAELRRKVARLTGAG
jgi:hypothetical protein